MRIVIVATSLLGQKQGYDYTNDLSRGLGSRKNVSDHEKP